MDFKPIPGSQAHRDSAVTDTPQTGEKPAATLNLSPPADFVVDDAQTKALGAVETRRAWERDPLWTAGVAPGVSFQLGGFSRRDARELNEANEAYERTPRHAPLPTLKLGRFSF